MARITNHQLNVLCGNMNRRKEFNGNIYVDSFNNVCIKHPDSTESTLFHGRSKREAFVYLNGLVDGIHHGRVKQS